MFIQVALFSHTDGIIYSVDETIEMALQCQKEGAQMVHFHIYKVGGIDNFMKIAHALEEEKGPYLMLSVSDFEEYKNWYERHGRKSSIIKSVAIHAGDCIVFDNFQYKTYEQSVKDLEESINMGFFPEISIFNRQGAEYCTKLNSLYPKKFFVCVYLGYKDELPATVNNIKWMSEKLKDCFFTSFAFYNDLSEELLMAILDNGGQLRCGMEDNTVICGKSVSNSLEIVKIATERIKK